MTDSPCPTNSTPAQKRYQPTPPAQKYRLVEGLTPPEIEQLLERRRRRKMRPVKLDPFRY